MTATTRFWLLLACGYASVGLAAAWWLRGLDYHAAWLVLGGVCFLWASNERGEA